MRFTTLSPSLLLLAISPLALAHGDHSKQEPLPGGESSTGGAFAHLSTDMTTYTDGWAEYHMASEHHISNVDASVFFELHDFGSAGVWTADDVQKLYGLMDESAKDVGDAKRKEVVRKIGELFGDGGDDALEGAAVVVRREQFERRWAEGVRLPDLETGPGHHGDLEWEYEIHHWERYHADGATEADLTHPEDIEHFRKHDELEQQQEEWARISGGGNIVEANIPLKFKRTGIKISETGDRIPIPNS